ncbi:MAG: thiamine-phosphate kinase [Gammaproteobacteria bacterium]|nr:thiamine-phosphate kinase [Gammaproteobacteria bacterium]MDH5660571.1 thiamine-phosphate kinase [Gammaproteobacteria bacterium]
MPSEFDIIRQYFTLNEIRDDVVLGIGDDAAILTVPGNYQLVQSVDTLVAGVHFPTETSPEDIAYKALAVNLSDMAAMGAEPAWFTLAITLPNDDEKWLEAFSESLFNLARKYKVQLIGGDTTHGPLCISITINGFVPTGKALTRNTAQVTDKVYVSGTLGDAALALAAWQGQCLLDDASSNYLNEKLNRPTPQVELGLILRKYASACIDISDGLIADLGHITDNSQVGAKINFEKIPLSKEFKLNLTDDALIIPLVLSGGDDYQLCFTIPEKNIVEFEKNINVQVTCIGEVEKESGVRCIKNDTEINISEMGYQHFTND